MKNMHSATAIPMREPPALDIDETPAGESAESLSRVQALLTRHLPAGRLAIYEAGGGSTSYLPRSVRNRARVSVVDIDRDQLENNIYADEKVLGDIQTYQFSPETFDLIACYNVIEHLPRTDAALDLFVRAVRPGGLIFIGAPNPQSLSGVVTRFTPHKFHIWYYRRILGRKNAGLPGEPPFPTFFHPLVSPTRLRKYFASRGFDILYARAYESPRYFEMRQSRPVLARLIDGAASLANFLLAKRLNVRHGDYHLVVRKAEAE